MANRISRTGNTGSTPINREVIQFSGASDEHYFDSEWTPGKIIMVVNTTDHDVTVDGNVFTTGTWDLSEVGGMPLSSSAITDGNKITVTGAAGSHCIIDFRR